jgi:flagellar hook-basal body complex protein FliE
MNALSSLSAQLGPELRTLRTAAGGEAAGMRALAPSELERVGGAAGLESAGQVGTVSEPFEQALTRMVAEVNNRQTEATQAVNGLLSGGNVPLHQAMIATEEANVAFQLMVEVRNKLLESYQELMRMQI